MATSYIKDWRLYRQMTLEQVATTCSATRSQISRLESGERRLTLDWLEKIAAALDVAPNDLLRPPTDYGKKKTAPPAGSVMLTEVSGIKSEHLDVVEVRGDGMVPTFAVGDRLIIDRGDRAVTSGVYIVDFGGGPEIKRVALSAKSIRLSTDNPIYAPFDVDPKRLKVVGRVVARISRV